MSYQNIFNECFNINININTIEQQFLGLDLIINLYLTILKIRTACLIHPTLLNHKNDINNNKIGKYLKTIQNHPDINSFTKLNKKIFITKIINNIIVLASKYNCETIFLNKNSYNILVVNPDFNDWEKLMNALDISETNNSKNDESTSNEIILGNLLGYPEVKDFKIAEKCCTLIAYFENQYGDKNFSEIYCFKTNKEVIIQNADKIKNSLQNIQFLDINNNLWTFLKLEHQLVKFDIIDLQVKNRRIISTFVY
jgi:hypothetical protein